MASGGPLWFRRFGDIPGVAYETPANIDVNKLRRRGERPEVQRYPDLPPLLFWGYSTASPARAHAIDDPRTATTRRLLTNLAQLLELPGSPSEYHFAIQNVVTTLKARRRQGGAAVFAEIERLAWLDLQLIQALPGTVRFDYEDDESYYGIESFTLLTDMYLKEGALADALRVVAIAEAFGQGGATAAEKARTRADSVAAEDRPQ